MTGYGPKPPVDTPNPCGGEPWRETVDGVVQCISDYVIYRHPDTGQDMTPLYITVVIAGLFIAIGLYIHLTRNRPGGPKPA